MKIIIITHIGLIAFCLFPFIEQSSFQEVQPLCMQKMPLGSTLPYSLWGSLSLGFVMGCRCVYTCMHRQSNHVMGLGRPFVFHMAFEQGSICVTWTRLVTIPQLQPAVKLSSWASWDFITFFKGPLTLVAQLLNFWNFCQTSGEL